MNDTYRELRSDADLLAAALLQVLVYVVDAHDTDEVVDFGGVVEAYTLLQVKINGEWHGRHDHSFRVDL
ncbi:hypothetical protein [Saccharibacillus alkalitolerans]|uniref:Uncharacterized protein n=1 Tax=Saccharibacillus alkalitolerans TaxID=2705290 RepID=A0ABX0F8J5_9BACL|nr:hypothetical protein [Saccharibacillus alkalitolerans]NGZ75903.1 hypothetical protein [Saccharibacillus alkalitolerans]